MLASAVISLPLRKKQSTEAIFWYKNGLVNEKNYLWVSNVMGYVLSDMNVSTCITKSLGGAGGMLLAFFF